MDGVVRCVYGYDMGPPEVLQCAREGYVWIAYSERDGFYVLATHDITMDGDDIDVFIQEEVYHFLVGDTKVSIVGVYQDLELGIIPVE